VEVVENNYKNIYYIMKHREILNILILVASAFLLVAVLSYFNLYEGMETGLYEGMEPGLYEGLDGEEEQEGMDGEDEQEGMEDGEEQEGMEDDEQEGLVVPTQGVVPAAGGSSVLKYSGF
jgi:hypothetical protein